MARLDLINNKISLSITSIVMVFACVLPHQAFGIELSPDKFENNNKVSTAKIDGFLITCDKMNRDLETGESELVGNVQIIYQDQHFSADYVKINQNKKSAYFQGNVVINSPVAEIGGDRIQLNYIDSTAEIQNGYVKSNNIYFTGKSIRQNGPNKFHVSDAEYTTCSNCPATWSFDGTEIDAELGGYAFLKSSFLKVSGFPILWLPYLIVPLKNERQTGLLPPEIGFIRDRKLVFSQSLFLALSRSQDTTITLKNYEIGGLKKQIEYRHALNDKTTGEVTFSHLNDSLFPSKKRYSHFVTRGTEKERYNRWSIKGYNQYNFTDNSKLSLSVNQVSDLQYPQDFSDEYPNYSQSGLENRLNYTNNNDGTSLSINAIYYQHLLSANALAHNSAAVHQFPEVKYNSTIQQIGKTPYFYSFNINYAHFERQKKYDDIAIDGTGQKYVANSSNDPRCENLLSSQCYIIDDMAYDQQKDLIRTGDRVQMKGTLHTHAYSLLDRINISPELSYNESHYLFPVGDDRYSSKRYFEFDVLSRSKLYNIYESEEKKYKHEFIPELSYRWIPWIKEDNDLFFGRNDEGDIPIVSRGIISDKALTNGNGVQYDYTDRVYDRNLITLTLINRVVEKDNATMKYTNKFDWQIKQSYDVYQALYGTDKDRPLSDLSSISNLYSGDFTFSNQTNYYPYLSATNSTTSITYLNSLQQYFKVGYISKRSEEPKQDDVSLSLGFVTNYINLLTGVILDTSENRQNDSRVKKVSLITQIKPPGECWAINFYRDQKVGLEAEWKIRFDFSWDGKPTKIIPPHELNIN